MPIKIHVLTASKDVKPYAAELRSVAKSAVESVKKLLPIKNVDIVFYDNPGATFNENELGGIGVSSPNFHTILIALNPHHPNFKNALKKELVPFLIRELQHTIDIRE